MLQRVSQIFDPAMKRTRNIKHIKKIWYIFRTKNKLSIYLMLTDELINKLITEEKTVTEPPKKDFRIENQHFRNDFHLTSVDGTRRYSVFMRQHITFKENFSIGLVYYSEEGTSYNLFRCNGNHGEVVVDILNPAHHQNYHTHKITAELLENNINDPKHIESTNEYASYEQAMKYFCKYINIKDTDKYFPNINQIDMFE